MRSGLLGAAVLVGILMVYWAALFVWQRSLLFPAPSVSGAPPRPGDAEVVWLEIGGDSVEAWFLPPLVDARDPAPLRPH